MTEDGQRRGYGNSSGPSDFGSDFISFGSSNASDNSSFGSNNPSDNSYNQWRPRGGRRGRPQMISGTRNYKPFQEDSHRGGWNNRGSDRWGSNQPFHQRRGGPFRGGGFDHQRGNRHQRHQGSRSHYSNQDISSYYHPSMLENPWLELETLLQIPQNANASSSLESESARDVDSEKIEEDQDSDHSNDSNDSE